MKAGTSDTHSQQAALVASLLLQPDVNNSSSRRHKWLTRSQQSRTECSKNSTTAPFGAVAKKVCIHTAVECGAVSFDCV